MEGDPAASGLINVRPLLVFLVASGGKVCWQPHAGRPNCARFSVTFFSHGKDLPEIHDW